MVRYKSDLIFNESYLHELLKQAADNQWLIYGITESDQRKQKDDNGSHVFTIFYNIYDKKNPALQYQYKINTVQGIEKAKEFLFSILTEGYMLCDICQSNFKEFTFVYLKINLEQHNNYEQIETIEIEPCNMNDWLRKATTEQWEILAVSEYDKRNSLNEDGKRFYTIFYCPVKKNSKKRFIYWIKSVIDIENARNCVRRISKYGSNVLSVSESKFAEYTFVYKVKECPKTQNIELEEL